MFMNIPINPTSISIAVIGLFALIALILSSVALAKIDDKDRWGTKAMQLTTDSGCKRDTPLDVKMSDNGFIGAFPPQQTAPCIFIVGLNDEIMFTKDPNDDDPLLYTWTPSDGYLPFNDLTVGRYEKVTVIFSDGGKNAMFTLFDGTTITGAVALKG